MERKANSNTNRLIPGIVRGVLRTFSDDVNGQFTRELTRALKRRRMTKADLARAMGANRSMSSRLCGTESTQYGITLTSACRAARALGGRLSIRLT